MEKSIKEGEARRLVATYGIADAHYDLGPILMAFKARGAESPLKDILLPRWVEHQVRLLIAAIFVDDQDLPEKGMMAAEAQIQLVQEEILKTEGRVLLIRSLEDLERSLATGAVGIVLSMEGLCPIGEDLSRLAVLKDSGVQGAGLVWSRKNALADGSRFSSESSLEGLSPLGREGLIKMADLHYFLDLSHLNDVGTDDVLMHYGGPLLASHSNARSVADVTRNLTDGQIRKLAARGGFIGINNAKPFLSTESRENDDFIPSFCDHIDYIWKLSGAGHVGFGFDFCDELESLTPVCIAGLDESMDGLKDYSDVLQITGELLRRGYEEQEIAGILSGNLISFLRQSFK